MATESSTSSPFLLTRPGAKPYEIDWTGPLPPTHMEDWAALRDELHTLMLLFDGEMLAATDAGDQHTAAWNAICAHHAQELIEAIGHLFREILPRVQ